MLPFPAISSTVDLTSDTACSTTGEVGEVLWQTELGGTFSGQPAIKGNMSYIGQFNEGTQFFALRDDGNIVWQSDIEMSMESAPAISEDGEFIYVNTLNQRGGDIPDETNGIPTNQLIGTLKLDRETGEVLAGGDSDWGSDGSPLVTADGERVYAATVYNVRDNDPEDFPAPQFYAFDADSLDTLWSYEIPGWAYSSPVVGKNGNVFFGAEVTQAGAGGFADQGEIISLNKDGEVRWIVETDSEPSGGPAIYKKNGKRKLIVRTQDGDVYKIKPKTGEVVWQIDLDATGFGAPVLGRNNKRIFVTTGGGGDYPNSLVALGQKNGTFKWAYTFDNDAATPVIGDEAIYILSASGEVIALDYDGNELWTTDVNDEMYYGYMTMNNCGVLHFVSEDGTYYAVQTESGGLEPTSDYPKYRGDYKNTGQRFQGEG